MPAGRATGSCRPAPPRPAPRAPGAVTGSGEKQRQEQRRPHAGCRWLRAPGLKLACCAELRLGAAEPGPPRRGARGERRPRSSPARPGPARSSPAQPAPAQPTAEKRSSRRAGAKWAGWRGSSSGRCPQGYWAVHGRFKRVVLEGAAQRVCLVIRSAPQ